jgi:prephenate dehydrogenase
MGSTEFSGKSLAVCGPGLLGGSVLMEARALGFRECRAWSRRLEGVAAVRASGLVDHASDDVCAVVRGADVVVLCVPVEAMPRLAEEMVPVLAGTEVVVTDVGSVKGWVEERVAPVFAAAGISFVGAHPMAGSEKGGLGEARCGLFAGAACIVTPRDEDAAAARLVRRFWEAMGCRVTAMTAGEHDRTVARVSHLPHAAAVLAALTALGPDPAVGRFAAGGLRDTTRVASGDPSMWRGILVTNREAMMPVLAEFRAQTDRLMGLLERGDGEALQALLEEAKRLRGTRYS